MNGAPDGSCSISVKSGRTHHDELHEVPSFALISWRRDPSRLYRQQICSVILPTAAPNTRHSSGYNLVPFSSLDSSSTWKFSITSAPNEVPRFVTRTTIIGSALYVSSLHSGLLRTATANELAISLIAGDRDMMFRRRVVLSISR